MTVTDDLPPSAPATAKGDIPVTQYSPGEYTSNASATHQHGSGWHMWLMLACCLAPLAAILAVTVFRLQLNSVLTFCVRAPVPADDDHNDGRARPYEKLKLARLAERSTAADEER